MINKYLDPAYDELINRVQAWKALEGGYYNDKQLRDYNNHKWESLSESQMETEIAKAQAGFKSYYFCPDCGRKFLIKDAVIKRKLVNTSLKLDNAAMPGWMKITASSESYYIRFCSSCSNGTNKISYMDVAKAYDCNAIVNKRSNSPSDKGFGCFIIVVVIISILCIVNVVFSLL